MKRQKIIIGVVLALFITLAVGFFLGRWTYAPEMGVTSEEGGSETQTVYTCSMHPQIRLNNPGKCPICEMPLIPAGELKDAGEGATSLTLSEHALAMAGVETVPVEYRKLTRDLRAVGKIQYNESALATITARVDGYAEKLFVNITGVNINAGDHLVDIYSPDLIIAQQELLIAVKDGRDSPLVENARLKLRRWGLTEKQVDDLMAGKEITERATLFSPVSGTVIEKTIFDNSTIKAGDMLYRIANLDTVWAYIDIYEFDLAWVRYGQEVKLTAEAYPGQIFSGMITFVEPVLNEDTRTVRVPVHVENKGHALKPGMYVSAVIKATLAPDGKASPTGIEGRFTCHMHPQVMKDHAGACPACGMPLKRIPGAMTQMAQAVQPSPPQPPAEQYACPMKCEGDKTYEKPGNCPVCNMKLQKVDPPALPEKTGDQGLLSVPVTADLDSGTRKIVYVEKGRGTFEGREVSLGPRTNDFFPVLSGLTEKERVVVRGGFLIDSQFQITVHPSLYYPGGLYADIGPSHGGTMTTTRPPEAESFPDEPTAPSPEVHRH
jgi:Cu(I)/Ag(I) efflux system membrane fusion protein